MALCEVLIAADVQVDCSNPIRAGLQPFGYIMNKSDIESVTESDGIVSAIKIKTGKKAYQIQQIGRQPFNGTAIQMQENDLRNTFNKVVSFVVMDNSPEVSKDIIEPLLNGEFVVVTENKYNVESKQNAFEIVGLETGARATDINQNKYENQAAWVVELTETETPVANKFFFTEDYDKTKEALDALLTTAQ